VSLIYALAIAGLVGFAVARVIIPVLVKLTSNVRIADHPDDARRRHRDPIPRIGGVGILAATIWGVLATLALGVADIGDPTLLGILPGFVFGGIIIFAVGLFDDFRGVKPLYKLVAQISAALLVVGYGFRIDNISWFGDSAFSLGYASVPLTILWIVGMTNAFNLIDGIDGLAGTLGLIGLTAALGVEVFLHPGGTAPIITAAVIGATFAFLRFNTAPARVFLGDSGATFLGFFLSIRLVLSSTTDVAGSPALLGLVPLAALAYPILDTSVAMFRRWLRGYSMSRADDRHIHHQLLALGMTPKQAVAVLGGIFGLVAAMGITIAFAPPAGVSSTLAGIMVLLIGGTLVGSRALKYHEFTEFGGVVRDGLRNTRRIVQARIAAREVAGQLTSARSLEELNVMLSEVARDIGFIDMMVVPHEGRASTSTPAHIAPVDQRPYRLEFPLSWKTDEGMESAVLRVWCARPSGAAWSGVERVVMRLAPAIESWAVQTMPRISTVRRRPALALESGA
jgi:UDP-GlcNAc:undecaprenyl-phosphate GlcNAc-1-phosphate transferase